MRGALDRIGGSLTTKLLAVYVPLLTVCVVSLFAILEYTRTSSRADILQQSLERLAISQNAGIAKALWEYDQDAVVAIIEELAEHPDFHHAVVAEPDGSIVYEKMLASDHHVSRILNPPAPVSEELSLKVGIEQMAVGTLTLSFHAGRIEAELYENLKQDALIVIALGFVVVVITVLSIDRIIGKPLTAVKKSIDRNRTEGKARPIVWRARDEIGQLVDAFNDLQVAQEKAAADLRAHRDALEETVADRTKALRESEATLNSAFENIPDGVYVIDGEGRLIKFNSVYLSYLARLGLERHLVKEGMDFVEILGWLAELGIYGDGAPDVEIARRMRFYRSNRNENHLLEGQTGDVFEVRKAPLGDGGSVTILVDLTEMRRSQEKLRESEERLRFAMDAVGANFWVNDVATGSIEYNSVQFFESMGYVPSDIPVTAGTYMDLVRDEDRDDLKAAMTSHIRGSSDLVEAEYRIRRGTDGWRWVLSRGKVIDRDGKGNARRIAGISLDIDDIKRKTELLASVLSGINQGLAAFDEDLRVITHNQRFLDIRDYPQELVRVGTTFEELMRYDVERHEFGEGDQEQILQERLSVASRFQPHFFERERPNGTIIEVSGGPLPSGGFVSTYTDVTERRRAEQALASAHALISESVQYAKQIQSAVLSTPQKVERLFPDSFVVWEPRDVVGGDMYWVYDHHQGPMVIVIDCTGHGVPGAILTMIASGAFQQTLSEIPHGTPGVLLSRVNRIVQATLGQADGSGGGPNDGLEAAIGLYDADAGVLRYAGAGIPIAHVSGTAAEIVRTERGGLGYVSSDPDREFEDRALPAEPGDRFVFFSDGVSDQIGGPRGRAYGKKRFLTALSENRHVPITELGALLYDDFKAYQGDNTRRDDLTMFGFQIPE